MDKNKVLGKALYLEFRKEQYTLQFILTPEAVNEAGEYVPLTLMRRQISAYHPRKTWRFDNAGHGKRIERMNDVLNVDFSFQGMELNQAKYYAKRDLQFVKPLLSQMYHQGWKLEHKPVAVEFSQEDSQKISENATPQGLIRRILRVRDAVGFPKELFA